MSQTDVSRMIEVTACDWGGAETQKPFQSLSYNKAKKLDFCKEECLSEHSKKKEGDEHYRRLLYKEVL